MPEQTGLSNFQRLAIVIVAVAVLVVAYVVIQGASNDSGNATVTVISSTTPTNDGATTDDGATTASAPPATPTVRVVNAKPQGGVQKLTFKKGDEVRFRVVSDTADEIHVHGYDRMKDVPKDGAVTFAFKGSIDGRFVVELEEHGEQIAELDVTP